MYVNNCKGKRLAKVYFKGLCWLQRLSYKPTHKDRTLPSHPIEKSTVVHDALLFHPHHHIFSNTAKIFSYPLVVNLGTSLEKYCKNHTLWSKVDLLQVQTGDRWYYKVSFSFSCLFHGNRLQNRKQNRSLLLQGGGAVQCCIRVFNLGEEYYICGFSLWKRMIYNLLFYTDFDIQKYLVIR